MPVFEALLPRKHDVIIQDILFALAYWHALAKLRMHTDSTLEYLQKATTWLGTILRRFVKHTCSAFDTRELPREAATRGRRQNKKQKGTTHQQGSRSTATEPPLPSSSSTSSKKKHINLLTYKLHALGDYVAQIARFGTTDSYSTQRVCCCSFWFSYTDIFERANSNIVE
jgi:hypothetical protein